MAAPNPDLSPEDKSIRKIRKKLRQIEHLELVDRCLNEEESLKVSRKLGLRKDLQQLVKEFRPDEIDFMKRQGLRLADVKCEIKKARCFTTSNFNQDELDDAVGDPSASHSPPSQTHSNLSQSPTTSSEPSQTQAIPTPHPTYDEVREEQHGNQKPSKAKLKCETAPEESKGNQGGGGRVAKKKASSSGDSAWRDQCPWRDGAFQVFTLRGHNDIILAVDFSQGYILSASRDTTVRVWREGKCVEERSLRGHTAAVTSVAFLPYTLVAQVIAAAQADPGSVSGGGVSSGALVGVSGGLDCTIRVWDVVSGNSLGSIYTYNGITCLGCGTWGVVTGTEGGRLEFWSVAHRLRTAFVDAFQSQVSALHVCGDQICAGSVDGEVGVWQAPSSHDQTPPTLYVMEPDGVSWVSLRALAGLVQGQGNIYLGDSHPNLKVLAWKKNSVNRLVNHIGDIGMTDSLAVAPDGHILAASYFIDSGCPSVNVRDGEGRYVCTLLDGDEGRYLAMAAAPGVFVTAGHTLKVWIHRQGSAIQQHKKSPDSSMVFPTFLRKMSAAPVDSGSEDETDWGSSSDDDDNEDRRRLLEAAGKDVGDRGKGENESRWWCSVL